MKVYESKIRLLSIIQNHSFTKDKKPTNKDFFMKVLIIEDEEIAAEKLAMLVRRYDSNIQVLASIDSVKNAVKWLSQHEPP